IHRTPRPLSSQVSADSCSFPVHCSPSAGDILPHTARPLLSFSVPAPYHSSPLGLHLFCLSQVFPPVNIFQLLGIYLYNSHFFLVFSHDLSSALIAGQGKQFREKSRIPAHRISGPSAVSCTY